jgi:hypothetical protein
MKKKMEQKVEGAHGVHYRRKEKKRKEMYSSQVTPGVGQL